MTLSNSKHPVRLLQQTWLWQGFPICYQTQGSGPAVVLVHGWSFLVALAQEHSGT